MLKSLLLAAALALAALVAGPATAQDAADRAAIAAVIDDQMAAFVARDMPRAFSHASPGIKGMFGTAENFGRMVENGYPMVWDNSEVSYLELREIDGRLWQTVRIRDGAGATHVLDYQMIETAEGWQINGVRIIPAPDVGV